MIIGLAFRHRTASFQSKEMMQPASTPDNERKLLKAVQDNDKTTAVALLKAGTNVNCRDEAEWAPLHHAAYENRLEVAQVLLAHGADVNAPSSLFPRRVDGKTPVARAKYWEYREMEALLRQHGGH